MVYFIIMSRTHRLVLSLLFSIGILTLVMPVHATMSIEMQRKIYTDATKALKKGHLRTYRRLSKQITDYPLYGYLEYKYMRKRISRMPDERIKKFMDVYQDSPISARMRFGWLRSLERKGSWQKFLDEYQPGGGTKLHCSYATALYKTKQIEKANIEAEKLWLVGKSQPSKCDPVFHAWKKHGGMTSEHKWKRIELAMTSGRVSLARFIAKEMGKQDRLWVERWRKMHRRPAENLLRKYYKTDDPIPNMIVRHGVKRLARRDAGAAADYWESVRGKHLALTENNVHDVDQYIAMHAGYQKHPRALEWLGKLDNPDSTVQLWRIRTALSQQDWWSALTWIEALPHEERNSSRWRYWRGRILEMQSESLPALRTAAERIYTALAKERSYHGFLAADRLGNEYQFQSDPLKFTDDELDEIAAIPGVQRSHELLKLGLKADARREWNFATKPFNEEQLKKASVLASSWDWHDRAISTIAKAEHFDDLEVRFPMAYKDVVTKQAKEQGIDAAWIYGVLRQESGFMADARSHAGALGLMQLMPGTGRLTARELKFRIRSNRDLLNTNKNIRLGAAYLRRMLDKNEGNGALATASYNAGPYRVKKWLPNKDMPSDIWVETIPYNETRKYVRRVMSYTVIYDNKLGGRGAGLMRYKMPVIKARDSQDS